MADNDLTEIFLDKAGEALAGAQSEYANGRYNNCANRAYYAYFQAAIAALIAAEITPRGSQWGHDFVQGQFVGQLINRRKVCSADLRQVLSNTLALRQTADYEHRRVTEREASRALRWARPLLEAVQTGGEAR